MRPDLPWNVVGIPSEARDAARAAARREGLSVGEWLTRRIVAGLSDVSEIQTRTDWTPRGAIEPERQRRDSDEMLDRVARSESETAEVYRRIEEQLRGMARRLDASERSQTESHRVMSKAAVEMNIAAREQAQAFDQLGSHVANIAERLDRVETRDANEGMREAVKALHQGLSRLADQIAQTAGQSASQISSLAGNIETVAGRVGQARQDALAATQVLEGRLAAFDERVRTLEKTTQANADTLDRALDAIEANKRNAVPAEAIARLEDSVRRLEQRESDPMLDRRLAGIERTLADVVARIEPDERPDPLEDHLRAIVGRLEALETAQRDAAAELRRMVAEKTKAAEPPPAPQAAPPPAPPAPPAAASFGPLPAFEAPPFIEPTAAPPPFALAAPPAPPFAAAAPPPPPFAPAAPPAPPFAAAAAEPSPFAPAAFAAAPQPLTETLSAPKPLEAAADFAPAAAEPAQPTVESYLAAARRSARMAAQAEAQRSSTIGALRWSAKPEEKEPKRTRPLLVALTALVMIALIGGVILTRQIANTAGSTDLRALFEKPVATRTVKRTAAAPAKAPAAAVPQAAQNVAPAVPAAPKTSAAPSATTPPAVSAPAPIRPTVAQAPAPKTVPQTTVAKAAVAAPAPQQQAVVRPATPIDRLAAAASAGNSRAELIVGLKYLDGDGVPVNDAEAAKWLTRAADAGEPVAQYRLGTMYERGRGVSADAAKAVRWYLTAANQGSRKAMHNLAVAYAEGTGVKKDFSEASRWFLKAAALGLSDSQFNLAVLYERGLGVPQNLVDAYKWYAIAAAQGDQESKARLAAIASQLNSDERAAAQHAADVFKPGTLDARANVAPTIADVTRG